MSDHNMSTDTGTVAGRTDVMVQELGPPDEETAVVTEGDVEMDGDADQDDSEGSEEEMVEEDYETSRLRRIRENELLLSELGIHASLAPSASTPSLIPIPRKVPIERQRQRKARGPVYDRSGYIISRPNPGETFRMACVEMSSDRKILRKIADGEYQDCSHWAEGEERRQRFGNGEGVYQKGEKAVVGGVGPDFRWRKWLGTTRELRREMRQRGELNEKDIIGTTATQVVDGEISAYSSIPGTACHQCRRKSEKLKMKCRNTAKNCNAVFCETCCARYNDFEFDPDSRSFICPLCRNVCNCSNCLRKRGLAHLLEFGGARKKSLRAKLREQGKDVGDIQEYVDQQSSVMMRTPFDRVRIVMQDEDIISPDLPPEPKMKIIPSVKKRRIQKGQSMAASQEGGIGVKQKGQIRKMKDSAQTNGSPLKIRFRVPRPPVLVREKEVDSDGDTVGDWSGDDEDIPIVPLPSRSRSNSLTSLSSREPTPPRRLAFPPRPNSPIISGTTPFIANGHENGFINPAMMDINYVPPPPLPIPVGCSPLPSTSPVALRMESSASGSTVTSISESGSGLGPTSRSLSPTKEQSDLIQDKDRDHIERWKAASPPRPDGKKRKRPPPAAHILRSPRWLLEHEVTLPDVEPVAEPDPDTIPSGLTSIDHTIEDPVNFTSTLGDTLFSAPVDTDNYTRDRDQPLALPYSHSPPRRSQSPLIDPHDSFFQPTPMAYSLAQQFLVEHDDD